MIKKFNKFKLNESSQRSYQEVFDSNIKGQIVVGEDFLPAYKSEFYGSGLIFENGYKIYYYGGGCSGEDCNETFIVSPNNELISKREW